MSLKLTASLFLIRSVCSTLAKHCIDQWPELGMFMMQSSRSPDPAMREVRPCMIEVVFVSIIVASRRKRSTARDVPPTPSRLLVVVVCAPSVIHDHPVLHL